MTLPGVIACGANVTTTSVSPSSVKCSVSLASSPDTIPGSGGSGSVSIVTEPECVWTASTDADWISRLTPQTGQGTADLRFETTANVETDTRRGDIVVNEASYTIQQAPCGYHVEPAEILVPAAGGTRVVGVAADAGCPWNAVSDDQWIGVTSGGGGAGDGAFTIQVERNTGTTRVATVTVAGRVVRVLQLSPSSGGLDG